MNEIIKMIKEDSSAELIEKKSRFIANAYIIENKMQAEKKLEAIRKKYYGAKHHCFAFSVLEDGKTIVKMSDDGEPSGTAGEPILNIITKNRITKYFNSSYKVFWRNLIRCGRTNKSLF